MMQETWSSPPSLSLPDSPLKASDRNGKENVPGLDYRSGLQKWSTEVDCRSEYRSGLEEWPQTGPQKWTTRLDDRTGLQELTTRLDGRTGLQDWTTRLDHKTGRQDWTTGLARVVQKVDNAIHLINHNPADSVVCFINTYPLDSDLSIG